MFSRTKSLLKIAFLQNAFRTAKNQSTDTAGLESFLQSIIDSPPKQNYSLAFFDESVQDLLRKITNIDLEKVFKPRPRGERLSPPKYKLLTDEELQKELEEAHSKAREILQIPPVVNVKEDKTEIITSDPSLDGFDQHHAKHVVIDISPKITNKDRIVLVREPNGVLRRASRSEKFRANQIYSPIPGRELETPPMFLPEYLMDLLKKKEYEFVLNRACAQFEPDDQAYHEVISVTYNAINYCKDFQMLQSTRHYGSLAFYLISHKNIDNMFEFHLKKDGIDNAFSLVKLYHIIHPECKSAELSTGKTEVEVLKDFIEFDSCSKMTLGSILQNYLAKEQNKRELESGVREAHGL